VLTRRLPQRAGPPGQSAIRALPVLTADQGHPLKPRLTGASRFPKVAFGGYSVSVVEQFYCWSGTSHKTFRNQFQDSLVMHRSPTSYPPFINVIHRTIHRPVHRSAECGVCRRPGPAMASPPARPGQPTSQASSTEKDKAPACMRCRDLAWRCSADSPIAPASWPAGAIGDPCSVRPTAGPRHPPESRSPGPPTVPKSPSGDLRFRW
jgi:hypothetical protein